MRTVFLPSLLGGLCGDPGLWVDLLDEGRSILLDLGDLAALATRKLLRVERVVVSHTHMDHFIGFDTLLRSALGRERELVVTGPPGFLASVTGRIDAYTWNLIESYPIHIRAEEIDGDVVRAANFRGAGGMRPEPVEPREFTGTLHAERLFTLHVETLDHGIPVLATALRETEHISVNRDRLDKLGLAPGEWLRDLKQAAREHALGAARIEADTPDGSTRQLVQAEIASEILIRGPSQRLAYVTDCGFTPDNVDKIVALASDADLFVCEAAFLHEDVSQAASRGHLTARQAGELARAAGAKRLAPFHVSPRYAGREQEVLAEAADAFGGPVLVLPTE